MTKILCCDGMLRYKIGSLKFDQYDFGIGYEIERKSMSEIRLRFFYECVNILIVGLCAVHLYATEVAGLSTGIFPPI